MVNFLIDFETQVGLTHINREYVFEYCCYQFEYMFSKMPRYIENRIPFSQIYNKKALQRWLDKTAGYMYYVTESLQKKGVSRNHIIPQSIITRGDDSLIEQEEQEKRRYHNKANGLSHCLIATSLYNPKSSLCGICRFSETCKVILKKQCFALYIDRNYVQAGNRSMQSV